MVAMVAVVAVVVVETSLRRRRNHQTPALDRRA
jgi:hypothetical protein